MRKRLVNLYPNNLRIGSTGSNNLSLNVGTSDRERAGRAQKVDVVLGSAQTVLAILKDASQIGDGIPYLKPVAGLISTIIQMKKVCYVSTSCACLTITQELDDCKEAWAMTWEYITDISQILKTFCTDYAKGQPLGKHIEDACRALETSLEVFLHSLHQYKEHSSFTRFMHRQALQDDAEKCSVRVSRALELFRVRNSQASIVCHY
jgi:hypothetical protein